jgi:hypothetical protein
VSHARLALFIACTRCAPLLLHPLFFVSFVPRSVDRKLTHLPQSSQSSPSPNMSSSGTTIPEPDPAIITPTTRLRATVDTSYDSAAHTIVPCQHPADNNIRDPVHRPLPRCAPTQIHRPPSQLARNISLLPTPPPQVRPVLHFLQLHPQNRYSRL